MLLKTLNVKCFSFNLFLCTCTYSYWLIIYVFFFRINLFYLFGIEPGHQRNLIHEAQRQELLLDLERVTKEVTKLFAIILYIRVVMYF